MGLKNDRLTEGPHMGQTILVCTSPSTMIPHQQLEYRLPEFSSRQKENKNS